MKQALRGHAVLQPSLVPTSNACRNKTVPFVSAVTGSANRAEPKLVCSPRQLCCRYTSAGTSLSLKLAFNEPAREERIYLSFNSVEVTRCILEAITS